MHFWSIHTKLMLMSCNEKATKHLTSKQLAFAYQEEVWVHEDLIGLAFSSHGTNSAAIEAAVAVTMAAILREALPAMTDS